MRPRQQEQPKYQYHTDTVKKEMENSDFRDFLTGSGKRDDREQNITQKDHAVGMSPSVLASYNLMPRAINTKKRKIAIDDGEKSRFSAADSDHHNRGVGSRKILDGMQDLHSKEQSTGSQVENPAIGLDYELLNKVRSELQKSTEEELEKAASTAPKAKLSRDELLATLKKSRPSNESIPVSRFKPITQPKKEKKKKRKEKTLEKGIDVIKKDEAVTNGKPEEQTVEFPSAPDPPRPPPAAPAAPSPIDEEKGIFSDVEEYQLGQIDSDSDSDTDSNQVQAPLPSIIPGKYFDDEPQETTKDESNDIIKGVLQRVKDERIRAEKIKEATVGTKKPLPIQELGKGTDDSFEYDTSGLINGDLRQLGPGTKVSSDVKKSKNSENSRKERGKADAKLDREHAELEKFMQKDA